jgi:hypothetical protein
VRKTAKKKATVNPSSVQKIKKKMEKSFFHKVFIGTGQKICVQRTAGASPPHDFSTGAFAASIATAKAGFLRGMNRVQLQKWTSSLHGAPTTLFHHLGHVVLRGLRSRKDRFSLQ